MSRTFGFRTRIFAAGQQLLHGVTAGTILGTVTDDSGNDRHVSLRVVLVPGLGTNLFSVTAAMLNGVASLFYPTCPRLESEGLVIPMQSHGVDGSTGKLVCSIQVRLRAGTADLNAPAGLALKVESASLWHPRMGHINAKSLDVLRKQSAGVEYAGDLKDCSVCPLGKSAQQPHAKQAAYGVLRPFQLVTVDTLGPFTPVALGGFKYAVKFVDQQTKWKEVVLTKDKTHAVDALELFNKGTVIPTGERIHCIRADPGTEFTSAVYRQYCQDVGIQLQFASPNTPQQIGANERAGRTIVNIVRCMFADSTLPNFLWGELMQTAMYLSNRTPHAALHNGTPYKALYGKEAYLGHVRVIGSRAFVHEETHTRKLEHRAWEGRLVGYSTDSKSYRVYNAATRRVRVSRNVVFIETPPAPPSLDERGFDDGEFNYGDHDEMVRDVRNYTTNHSVDSLSSDHAVGDPSVLELIEQIADVTNRDLGLSPTGSSTANEASGDSRATPEGETPASPGGVSPPGPGAGASPPGEWNAAAEREIASLKERDVYKLVPRTTVPQGRKRINAKWVFKRKSDGSFKGRLVAQGWNQVPGLDCGSTYAPVCRMQSVRMLACLAVEHDLKVDQMDVSTAFLYAPIREQVFVEQTPGFEVKDKDGGELVMQLKKSLYGLAQSPGNWFNTIDPVLVEIGFVPLKSDTCVYLYDHAGIRMYLTLYVDDLLLAGSNTGAMSMVKGKLKGRFKMTDMGEVSLVLGMEIKRDRKRGTLTISQEAYSKSILERFGMSNCKPTSTPGIGPELSNAQPEDTLLDEEETRRYQGIVGCLMYVAQVLRYDIMYATGQLARPMAKPSKKHMVAAKHTLRYLAGTTDFSITYKRGGFKLAAFSDSNWANNPDNGKSTSSYLTMLCNAPLSFKSGLQGPTAMSTMEAELVASALAMKEVVFCSNMLNELGFGKEFAKVPLYCDNTATLHALGNRAFSSRTKHIALRFFFIRELVSEGKISVNYIPTDSNPADIGTKHLNKHRFKHLMEIIRNFNVDDFISSKFN
eukprot:g13435.t1